MNTGGYSLSIFVLPARNCISIPVPTLASNITTTYRWGGINKYWSHKAIFSTSNEGPCTGTAQPHTPCHQRHNARPPREPCILQAHEVQCKSGIRDRSMHCRCWWHGGSTVAPGATTQRRSAWCRAYSLIIDLIWCDSRYHNAYLMGNLTA